MSVNSRSYLVLETMFKFTNSQMTSAKPKPCSTTDSYGIENESKILVLKTAKLSEFFRPRSKLVHSLMVDGKVEIDG